MVLHLTIVPVFNQTINTEACGSYPWNGQTYYNSGIYVDSFQTNNGCDSIVTLDLTVHPITSITLDSTVYDNFIWNGIVYTSSGTYTQNFSSVHGCDSTVTINLIMNFTGFLEDHFTEFVLYPNPANDQITINAEISLMGKTYLVYDHVGKIVLKGSFESASASLYLSNFSNGIYTLQIDGQGRRIFVVRKE